MDHCLEYVLDTDFHVFVDQRQPSQLRRPSVGRGPQLTPGIGSMVRDGVCVCESVELHLLNMIMVLNISCILYIQ